MNATNGAASEGGEGSGGRGSGGGGGVGRGQGRGRIEGLGIRHPIAARLPAVYASNDFLQRFTGALDTVLAPVLGALDNLPAYFDPTLAPADFVEFLAHWVAAEPLAGERRTAVASAVRLNALRGTRAGLAAQIRMVFGVEPELEDSGGAHWSVRSGSPFPGSAPPSLLVRLRVPDPAAVDAAALVVLVRSHCPAQLAVRTEILPAHGPEGPERDEETTAP